MEPNHHAHFPPFAGVPAYVAGVGFLFGRASVADLVADRVGLASGDRLIDIGCGPGVAVRRAVRRGAASAVGVDPSAEMLRIARAVTRDPRIDWCVGAAEALAVPDGDATVVWSLATVHHWQDLDRGLSEVRRALAPGGRFAVAESVVAAGASGLSSHGWIPAQAESFAALARAAGFADVRVERHAPGRRETLVVLATRS